jgi:hypothetical protein
MVRSTFVAGQKQHLSRATFKVNRREVAVIEFASTFEDHIAAVPIQLVWT